MVADAARQKVLDEYQFLDKVWAAISDDQVVAMISMKVADSEDFASYREESINALSKLGDAKSGDLVKKGRQRYFVRYPNHRNRSKNPKPPTFFEVPDTL